MGTFSNPFKIFFALSVETFHTYELHFLSILTELLLIATRSDPTVSGDHKLRARERFPLFILHSPSKVLKKLIIVFFLVPNGFKKEFQIPFAWRLFISANKTTNLALWSTVRRKRSAILVNCLCHGVCSGA